MLSKKVLPQKKSHELVSGSQFYIKSCNVTNRQFNWLKIFLVSDKSDKQAKIFDSWIAELPSANVTKVKVELKFDLTDKDKKHQIYNQFMAYSWNEFLMVLLNDCVPNVNFQELSAKGEYFCITNYAHN